MRVEVPAAGPMEIRVVTLVGVEEEVMVMVMVVVVGVRGLAVSDCSHWYERDPRSGPTPPR